MDAQKIGNLINYLRIKKALTQKQLAVQINVSDKAVSKWERGDGCPDVGILPKLAEVLETDVDSLLKGELPARKVLTEEEIKAMQAQIAKEENDTTDTSLLKNPAPKIKIYDFKRPDIFGKNELRKIWNIFVVLCEKLRNELAANRNDLLGIEICSVDQLTNDEFLRTVPQRTFFYNYDYNNSGFAIEVDPSIGKVLLKHDLEKYPELTQTDAECLSLAYIRQFAKMIQNEIYANTDQSLSREDFEKQLTSESVLPSTLGEHPSEMCVLVTLALKTDSENGMINIQFNYKYFSELCSNARLFGREDLNVKKLTDIKARPIENNIFVEFGRFASDSVSFEPGTILITGKRCSEPLNVVVENKLLFGGEVVVVNENFGVRIVEVKTSDAASAGSGDAGEFGAPVVIYNEEHYIALRLGESCIDEKDLERIKEGSVLELNTLVGSPIMIIQDSKCVARGEVVIADDFYAVRVVG